MSTVTQNISVEIPDVMDFSSRHVIRCGRTWVDIVKNEENDLWRSHNDFRNCFGFVPDSFEEILSQAKEYVIQRETARLLHETLASTLGEF